MRKSGYAWAGNKYFAELYKVTNITISKWIRELKEYGYITVEFEYKGKQIIKRKLYLLKKSLIPIKEKDNTPIKEKFKENNTSTELAKSNRNKQTKEQKTAMQFIENSNESLKVQETLKEYVKSRIAMKSNMTEYAIKMAINKLNKLYKTDTDKIACIEQSIMNGWKGLFEVKDKKQPNYEVYRNKKYTEEEDEASTERLIEMMKKKGFVLKEVNGKKEWVKP